jgi:hypothetical protein
MGNSGQHWRSTLDGQIETAKHIGHQIEGIGLAVVLSGVDECRLTHLLPSLIIAAQQ